MIHVPQFVLDEMRRAREHLGRYYQVILMSEGFSFLLDKATGEITRRKLGSRNRWYKTTENIRLESLLGSTRDNR